MKKRRLLKGVMFAVFAAVALAVFGLAVMLLWNWLTPAIFGWKTLTFWQALGLVVLTRTLFGGFRGRPGGGMAWRHRMGERWEKMTPEERDKMREVLLSRCHRDSREPPAAARPTA
jgi:hypothetical protein